jgi:hypothetical protein
MSLISHGSLYLPSKALEERPAVLPVTSSISGLGWMGFIKFVHYKSNNYVKIYVKFK